MNIPSARQRQLDTLANEITTQHVCGDLAAQATQLVMGDGNPNASIVFIGEAPGKNEDLQGKPFVGAAGKFLDTMLQAAGLQRSDVYITNIVKYRPPNNRDPLPEEKKEFWPYLLRQLEIIDPKVVITLGRHSGGYFIPNLQIGKDHGHARVVTLAELTSKHPQQPGVDGVQGGSEQRTAAYMQYAKGAAELPTQQAAASDNRVDSSAVEQGVATWLVVPLYHPAAALYNGGMRQTLIDDFLAAAELAQKSVEPS